MLYRLLDPDERTRHQDQHYIRLDVGRQKKCNRTRDVYRNPWT